MYKVQKDEKYSNLLEINLTFFMDQHTYFNFLSSILHWQVKLHIIICKVSNNIANQIFDLS